MSAALQVVNGTPEALVAVEQMAAERKELIRKTVAPDATPAELDLFIYDCLRRRTHPLDRMIHFTKRGGRYTPITGIDYMRSLAGETDEHAGTDDAEFAYSETDPERKFPLSCKVTVYKITQGQRYAYAATARWAEYYPGDGTPGFMWRKLPHVMLAKVAESLALRKAFPRQLGGLYAKEELEQAGEPTARQSKSKAEVVPPNADEDKAEMDEAWGREPAAEPVRPNDPPGWMRIGGAATPEVWPPTDLVPAEIDKERRAAHVTMKEFGIESQEDRWSLYGRVAGRDMAAHTKTANEQWIKGWTAGAWRRVAMFVRAINTPPDQP
jgi:phage recombination protein Bet